MNRCTLLPLILVVPLAAQTPVEQGPWHWGVKLGAQLTDSFNTPAGFNAADVSRFKIGPMIEYDFNQFFSGEANALYNRMSFDALVPPTAADAVAVSNTRAHALDFPFLAKWKPWGVRDFSPYVGAGVSLRYVNSSETRRFFGGDDGDAEFDRSFAQVNSFNAGFTLTGGIAFPAGERVRLSPELRWTAWGRDNFKAPSFTNPAGEQLDYQNNQVELLLGITF